MPFIKLDDDTIQRLLATDDPRAEMEKFVLEAEANNDTSVIQPTFTDVLREIGNRPDAESQEIN